MLCDNVNLESYSNILYCLHLEWCSPWVEIVSHNIIYKLPIDTLIRLLILIVLLFENLHNAGKRRADTTSTTMTSFQQQTHQQQQPHKTDTTTSYEIINNFCLSEPEPIDLKSKLKRNCKFNVGDDEQIIIHEVYSGHTYSQQLNPYRYIDSAKCET